MASISRDYLILKSGETSPCNNQPLRRSPPAWLDQDKFERARQLYQKHFFSILFSHLLGLIFLVFIPSIRQILHSTGKSASTTLLFRRYVKTIQEVRKWYEGDVWVKDDEARKSILRICAKHQRVANNVNQKLASEQPSITGSSCPATTNVNNNNSVSTKNIVPISQYDMTMTQFAFVGFLALHPRRLGLWCSNEDLDCLFHFWRGIGFLLGIEDKYNLCSGDRYKTRRLCEDIMEYSFKPTLISYQSDAIQMSNGIIEAFSCMILHLRWKSIMAYEFDNLGLNFQFKMDISDHVCLLISKTVLLGLSRVLPARLLLNWYIRKRLDMAVQYREYYENRLK